MPPKHITISPRHILLCYTPKHILQCHQDTLNTLQYPQDTFCYTTKTPLYYAQNHYLTTFLKYVYTTTI